MKKYILKMASLFFLFLLMSFSGIEIYYNILNDDDYSLEKRGPDDHAL